MTRGVKYLTENQQENEKLLSFKERILRDLEEANKQILQAEKEYLNKYKDVEVNPHMTFKEAYTICYEYQKDKIKDSTLKTYGERIKYMGLLDNVELVNLD